jgi:bacillithiol biosynthesis deacetylase BshB1
VNLDVLAIAAHPDDVEITCGGTMIKMADMGKKTGVLDLTGGEMGTLGTVAERHRDAENAAKILGLTARENLGLPDSALEPVHESKLKIAAIIRKYKPQTVILPYKNRQRHPDHRIASILGYDACFLAGLAKAELDGQPPHRPHKIIYASSFMKAEHSFFVDISDQWERKKKSVAAYQSQFNGSKFANQIYKPGVDIFELMETYQRQYGFEVGCTFAEAFWMAEPIRLDDPTTQPVRSI